ncbi:kinase-like domain-containing protein [Armillaria mellea]|nr:kinase-like domain-containing protein [Armillaria mellea]
MTSHSPELSASSSSCCTHMHHLEEQIAMDALRSLVCKHARTSSAVIQTPPMKGSFNLVYIITFPDGQKWVARISEPSSTDPRNFESTVGTMRLISQKTSIPLPIIHAYDSGSNNSLGFPYMLTSFIEGVPLSSLWTKQGALNGENRRHIFQQIAEYMAQFRTLEFTQIGTLEFSGCDSSSYTIGPLREIKEGKVIYEIGPFSTTLSYMNELSSTLLAKPLNSSSYSFSSVQRLISLFLPDKRFDGPPFVLSPPDFDSQNLMIDPHTFDVTGFMDWDDVYVGPREGGYARYPSWITRDWDPIMYDYEPSDSSASETSSDDGEEEDTASKEAEAARVARNLSSCKESPATLQAHRDLYLTIYTTVDPEGADITRYSHIFEAVHIALLQPEMSAGIIAKLIKYIFKKNWLAMGDLLLGIEQGEWMKGAYRGENE